MLYISWSCAKSHMLSASQRQRHLLHVSAVDHRQIWSMNKSWQCVTLSGFLHSHIVRCRWNPISCGMHYSGWPVRKRFSSDHWRLWRSKPGSRIVGSTTKVELTTVADCQSSLHRLVTSIVYKSFHSGLRDSRRSGGGWKMSSYNGQSRWHSACVINLSVAALRRRAGGSIFVRTGNHGNGVDWMVPDMRRIEECSWASTRLTCVERCHTGQQYSAAE